jgi:phage-related protein
MYFFWYNNGILMQNNNKLNVFFYKTASGNEPVRTWLQQLATDDKKIIGEDIKTLQYGWPLGMPLVRSLRDRLWEIRSRLKNKKCVRIIFFTYENNIVLLHAFIKKTCKTSRNDILLALQRKNEIEKGD